MSICSSNCIISPSLWLKIKKYVKPPPVDNLCVQITSEFPARHTAIFWTFAPVLYKGHRISEWSWRNTVSSWLLEEEYWQIWSVVASTSSNHLHPVCAAETHFFHVDLEIHFTFVRLWYGCAFDFFLVKVHVNVLWQGRQCLWCRLIVGSNVFLVASLTHVGKNNSC